MGFWVEVVGSPDHLVFFKKKIYWHFWSSLSHSQIIVRSITASMHCCAVLMSSPSLQPCFSKRWESSRRFLYLWSEWTSPDPWYLLCPLNSDKTPTKQKKWRTMTEKDVTQLPFSDDDASSRALRGIRKRTQETCWVHFHMFISRSYGRSEQPWVKMKAPYQT